MQWVGMNGHAEEWKGVTGDASRMIDGRGMWMLFETRAKGRRRAWREGPSGK